jgi:hypothetical protein
MVGGSYQPHTKAAACFQQVVLKRNMDGAEAQ